jgi:molybdopterin-containing oxidoreductase family iron-sulfur binding subunit
MPALCNHCEVPPCVPICPTEATYKSEETGIVAQIYPRCIGCRYCAVACPYTVKYFNWFKPKWPEEMKQGLNPEVSVRTKSVIEKCTFCSHRLAKAHERAKEEKRDLRDGDYRTACMEMCPVKAITFGDLDDPESLVASLVKSPRTFRLGEDLGTEPRCITCAKGVECQARTMKAPPPGTRTCTAGYPGADRCGTTGDRPSRPDSPTGGGSPQGWG